MTKTGKGFRAKQILHRTEAERERKRGSMGKERVKERQRGSGKQEWECHREEVKEEQSERHSDTEQQSGQHTS